MTTPADVTGLRLWLKADAITGLADGAAVGTWSDSSGLGNDATEGTGGFQPTYQTNEVTGLPCVRFDGTDDRLSIVPANMLAASNNAAGFTAFAYVNLSTASFASRDIYSISNGVDGTAVRIKFGQRAATLGEWSMSGRRLDADVAQNLVGNQTQTGWQLITVVSDWANDDAFIYRDGNLEASTTTWLTAGNTSATNALAARVGCAPSGGSEFWIGDIAELVVYDNAVSTTDRLNLWAYFQAKYAPPIGRRVHRGPGHRRGPLGRMDLLRAYHHRHRSTGITVVSGALIGDVSATVTETDTVSAFVDRPAAVSAPVTCGSTVTAVVGTIGAVTSTVTAGSTVTAVVGTIGAVTATVTETDTVTGSVSGGALTGSVTATVTCGGTVSAAVAATGAITATVTCGSTVTAVVTRVGAVSATVTCGSTVSGLVAATGAVSATVTVGSTVTAVVGKIGTVTATVVCGSTVTGSTVAGVIGTVNVTVTAGSTVTALVAATGAVTSTITAGSTVTGVVARIAVVTATITAGSTVTAVGSGLTPKAALIEPGTRTFAGIAPGIRAGADTEPGARTAAAIVMGVKAGAQVEPGSRAGPNIEGGV
jgi:hypothetical protein